MKMREYMEKICVVLLLVVACVNSEVSIENGGYRVLIGFSPNVSPEGGKMLLDDMKRSIEDASEILHSATGLGFSKVVFKIPTLWDTSEWNITVEESLNFHTHKSDFLIDNVNDTVFGKLPFAQQYGGCGTPGRQITIPTACFDEANKFPNGISIAREWLKYRYGVFDENGYFADTLYPLFYTTPGGDPNEVKITDCTNEEVTYNFLDSEGNECSTSDKTLIERLDEKQCSIKPDENTENVTSSMMYFQEDLHTLLHICGKDTDHNHNSRSPNKQNALCFGQSIWDVVKKSPDFQSEANREEYGDIEYIYVQEAMPKVVVAWENTAHLKEKKSVITSVIKQFVIDLPHGSKCEGLPFKSTVGAKSFKLQDLNKLEDKRPIIDQVDISEFVQQDKGDINSAISTALDIFSSASGDTEGGTIIIISKSIQTAEEVVLQSLKDSKLCVMFLLFHNGSISTDDIAKIKSYESDSICATVHEFLTTAEDGDTFKEMLNIMETLLPPSVDNKERETAKIQNLTQGSPITLHIDESIEDVTFWVFSRKEVDSFYLKLDGEEQENAFQELYIGNLLALSYPATEAGDVEFGYVHETKDPMLTHVRVTTKEGKYFTGEIFIRDTSEGESVQMPVIIYAVIRYGAYPIQNAEVSATIERPNESDVTFELNDDGKGDPDITQNDGVYSRYFTMFSEKGTYTVKVTVKNNGQLTTFGADQNTDYKSCCGSFLNGDTLLLGEFTKEFTTTFEAISGRPDDGYKPSRISDLRVDKVTDDKVILKWTAPGEEADHGTAQLYEIKFFISQEEALNNFDSGKAILNYTASPKQSGEMETFEIDFSDFEDSGLYYMAIKTKNHNKTSDISNAIKVFIPEEETVTSTDKPDEEIKKARVNTKIVGIIIGVIVALIVLVILIYAAIYYVVVKPKRKKERKQNQEMQAPKPSENNALNPINFVSATTLIEHHNEKTKAKLENKDPPIFKEEDFEDRNSLPANEIRENTSNNDQQVESSNRMPQNNEPMPPKSPKRTTFV